ncbi:hypothetical protein LINPERHAP1_LOCUS31225 [Linum perenne]
MAATTSANFFNIRSNSLKVRNHAGSPSPTSGCSKIDGVAMWLVNGVAAAFFASLDRCSCIRIATVDDVEEGNDDAPLIMNDGNSRRRRTAAAGKGKKPTSTSNSYYGEFN